MSDKGKINNPKWAKGKYLKTDELKKFKKDLEQVESVLRSHFNDLKNSLENMKPYLKDQSKKDWTKDK